MTSRTDGSCRSAGWATQHHAESAWHSAGLTARARVQEAVPAFARPSGSVPSGSLRLTRRGGIRTASTFSRRGRLHGNFTSQGLLGIR